MDHLGVELAGSVRLGVVTVAAEDGEGGAVDGVADQRAEPGGGHGDIGALQGFAQQVFADWASADIADADDQNPVEHVERP